MMGMYTELVYSADLRRDTPQSVTNILEYMLDTRVEKPELPDHSLFKTERWSHMLRMASACFDTIGSTLTLCLYDGDYYDALNVSCSLKNYGSEIEHFIDWLDPYVNAEQGDYLGCYTYEEYRDKPTPIYKKAVPSEYNLQMVEKILKRREGPLETVPSDKDEFIAWLNGEDET